jgi:hypothetical protein
VIGIFALANAVLALVQRNGLIAGSPTGLRNIQVFLAVNLVLGFAIAWCLIGDWLGRVIWYKRTRDLVGRQLRTLTRGEQRTESFGFLLCLAWCGIARVLAELAGRQGSLYLLPTSAIFAFLFCSPVTVAIVVRISRDRSLRRRIRQDWGRGSWQEGMFRALTLLCLASIVPTVGLGGARTAMTPWFPVPPLIAIELVAALMFMGRWAMATRGR